MDGEEAGEFDFFNFTEDGSNSGGCNPIFTEGESSCSPPSFTGDDAGVDFLSLTELGSNFGIIGTPIEGLEGESVEEVSVFTGEEVGVDCLSFTALGSNFGIIGIPIEGLEGELGVWLLSFSLERVFCLFANSSSDTRFGT